MNRTRMILLSLLTLVLLAAVPVGAAPLAGPCDADQDGVALASIQGLYQIVPEKDAQIAALQGQNAALEARLAAVEQVLGLTK